MMPVIIVAPIRWSRSPLQTFFLALITLSGLLIAVGLSSNTVTKAMGNPWCNLWGSALIVGSVVSLAGSYWKNRLTGMLIERSGVFLLGGASIIWPVAVVSKLGINGALTSVYTIFFSVACFFQVRYINRHYDLILEAIAKEREKSE